MVNVGQTHRRLDAGEARRGGARRKPTTGALLARREQLRGEGGVAHPTVAVAEAGVAGAAGGDLFCGCRSSGVRGTGAAVCKQDGGRASFTLRDATSATDAGVGPKGHRSFTGDEPVRRSVSAPVEGAARGRIRQRGMGETMQRLTAVLLVLLARQGRHGVRRIDGGDHRHPRSETAALEMQQSFWRRVTRWRGRRRRGGARDHVGEVGQWLWVRGYGSASMEASAMAGNGRGEA